MASLQQAGLIPFHFQNLEDDKLVIKAFTDLEARFFKFQLALENQLELKIKRVFSRLEDECLEIFDTKFTPLFLKKGYVNLSQILSSCKLEKKARFYYYSYYIFNSYTLPIVLKNYFQKSPSDVPNSLIENIVRVDEEAFTKDIAAGKKKALQSGGDLAMRVMDVDRSFEVRDANVIREMENDSSLISKYVTAQISSQIRLELLEGIRNGESITKIRDRIIKVWDGAIVVTVPAKYDSKGSLIRQGYTRTISNKHWATIVARTEVSKAMATGKLIGYRQSGVVQSLQFSASGDERVCPICSILDGKSYQLEQADGVIPAHPMCRCTWIPLVAGSFQAAAKQADENISQLYQD